MSSSFELQGILSMQSCCDQQTLIREKIFMRKRVSNRDFSSRRDHELRWCSCYWRWKNQNRLAKSIVWMSS
ncbi:hypothetical protein CsSME_00011323 [Camellia sinensis var. sinensis]